MKLKFKNIIVIFLIAMLGAGVGTFSMVAYLTKDGEKISIGEQVVINQVTYKEKNPSNTSQVISNVYNTVVEIESEVYATSSYYFYFGQQSQTSTASGSGVIISSDGYIVTNEHVISGYASEDAVKVTLYNGEEYTAQIIGYDTRTDLAVLKIDAQDLEYAQFADSSELMMGEEVIAIGNPLGLGISCSNGIISALEKEIYINNVYLTVLQTNAAVNAGNSGGGLFDSQGNVVGIVNAKKSSSSLSETSIEGMGYAIPSNTVVKIVEELIENGYVKDRAALGIKVATSSSYYYQYDGVLVSEVIEGGSADQAGIQVNDIITSINGIKVSSYGDLSKILDSKTVGEEVVVTVIRNNKSIDFSVTLQQSVAN